MLEIVELRSGPALFDEPTGNSEVPAAARPHAMMTRTKPGTARASEDVPGRLRYLDGWFLELSRSGVDLGEIGS